MAKQHEWNQSENHRFREACEEAGLTKSEQDRFSDDYHNYPNRQGMSFSEIRNMATQWKRNNGGGFRRSDRN